MRPKHRPFLIVLDLGKVHLVLCILPPLSLSYCVLSAARTYTDSVIINLHIKTCYYFNLILPLFVSLSCHIQDDHALALCTS